MEWEVGGGFRRERAHVYLRLIHGVWRRPTQYCKAIILQLKKTKALWMSCRLLLPASFFTSCAVALRKTVFPGQGKELIHEPDWQGRKCLWMETGLHVPACCPSRLLAALLGEGQEESYRTSEVKGSSHPRGRGCGSPHPPTYLKIETSTWLQKYPGNLLGKIITANSIIRDAAAHPSPELGLQEQGHLLPASMAA